MHELVEVLRHLPLERVADEFVVLVDYLDRLAIEVSEEVKDRGRQHSVMDPRGLHMRAHPFDEPPKIGKSQLVRGVVPVLVKNVLIDLAQDLLCLQVFDLGCMVNQVKSTIVVLNEILNFLTEIKLIQIWDISVLGKIFRFPLDLSLVNLR